MRPIHAVLDIADLRIAVEAPEGMAALDSPLFARAVAMYGDGREKSPGSYAVRVLPEGSIDMPAYENKQCQCIKTIEDGTNLFFDSPFALSRVDLGAGLLEVCLKDENQCSEPVEWILLSHIRLLISLVTVERGGVPLHCSSLRKDDCCVAFTGPSGSGKTTVSRLLMPSWELLNDEFNIVLLRSDGWWVMSTPFTKHETLLTCTTGSCRLQKLFAVEHGSGIQTCTMSLGQAFQVVSSGAYVVPYSHAFCKKLFDNVAALCHDVDVMRLRFNRDCTVDDLISSIME